jgi:hypothetical protein
VKQEIGPPSQALRWGFKVLNLERGLITGSAAVVTGLAFIGYLIAVWAGGGLGPLDVTWTLRPVLVGTTLVALGTQTLLMSLFYSMLGLALRRD